MSLVALVAVVFSREVITLLFSERYAAASVAFALLMIGLQMSFIVNLMGYTMTAAGYPGRSLGQDAVRATINVLGDLLLIPIFGLLGPAFASLAAGYTANPVGVWLLRRSGVPVAVAPYAKQTLLLLLFSALFWLIQPSPFVAKIGIVLAFIVCSALLSTVGRQDLTLLLPIKLKSRPAAPEQTL
jgi:O-antigen/teichoic acid export membrane protein